MNVQVTPRIPLLDLDMLQTLVAIADSGSFSSAAAVVHRTPSAISMQVKKMEDMLGRPIFVRDSRSVAFAPDCAFLLEHARRMLALNREAVARFIQPDVQGVVRLGAPDDVAERFLLGMLRRFADTHCCVTVNVIVDTTDRMVEAYRSGELDLAIVTCEAGLSGSQEVEVLLRENLVWAMRRGGIAAQQEPLPVSVWDETCVWRNAATKALDAAGRDWRVAFQSGNISGQRAAILADLAVAPIAKYGLGGDIVEAPAKHGLPKLPGYTLGLLHGRNDNPAVIAAADHLRASFSLEK